MVTVLVSFSTFPAILRINLMQGVIMAALILQVSNPFN